ncbi:transcription factor grauzone-like [Toxorhynchites rutilus septentrionalis]|uniref:transcription factor grauzone-like n=1 Tax=Toxorhynchites rutilus septentrionalis TaxID=329112 RepID=UPI002479692E|nr:transcription factor grauzone-like [Toxorhynchites rutilus septentrionalis]XP_055624001.1 transcription factor grauzone-like [Toxorhynchites rutilus septentrionalis]
MENNMICRLCLYNNEDILSIFGDRLREAKIHEKLQQYLNLDIKEDDPLPKIICLKCFETVENFHVFYQEVAQNQTVFAYSSQPGMIVISDQNSHTTYILREEQTVGQSCIEIGDVNSIKIESIDAQALQYRASDCGKGIAQKVTLVQLPDEVTTAVLSTTGDSEGGVIFPGPSGESSVNVIASGLPTYDESQQDKVRQVITVMKEELGNAENSSQDIQQSVNLSSAGQMQSFNLIQDADLHSEDDQGEEDDDEDDEDEAEENETEQQKDCEDGVPDKIDNHIPADYKAFPKKLINENRLVIRGKDLSALMAQFYELSCELCGEAKKGTTDKFSDMDSYLAHCKQVHNTKGYVWCCSQKILRPRLMAMHMARHLQPEAFKCPECGKLMTSPKILQYHIQNHRPEEERPLKCNICPRRFSYGSALMSHSQSHLPEEERTRHVCDECGKSYSTAKKLTDHVQSSHCRQEQFAYVCHICAKQFSSKSNLSYHLTTHQPKIHQVQCGECKKWLKNKLCLRKHMVQHSMVRHKCNMCDYSAVNMQCLRNHMRVQHTDLKPFSCDVCGKSFKLKNTLLNHQVQHTGVKKFTCEFCLRTFASSGNYYAHRKRMHPQQLAVQKMRKEEEENEFRKNRLLGESKC